MSSLTKTTGVPITVSLGPAVDDTDFKSYESVAYGAGGISVYLFKQALNGAVTATQITPSNTNDNDHNYWLASNAGMHYLRITAAQNNVADCELWVEAVATGVAPFGSPRYRITSANVNDALGGTDALDVSTIQWLGTAPLALSSQQVQAVVPDTQKVDIETIKTQAVTAAAGVTVPASIGTSTYAGGAVASVADVTNITNTMALETTLTKIKKWLQLAFRKDAAIATDNATELAEINADGGTGAGAFDNATDATEAIRDRGDSAWTTADVSGVLGAVAGKVYRNADGTQIKFYDAAGALLSTLDWNTGTNTWDVTWA